MSMGDELAHQMKLAASQQTTYPLGRYGHIASYDAKTHRVRLVIPSLTDGDGNYVLTSWMPLATMVAGSGWGFQAAPMGGASVQSPTNGELCEMTIKEGNYGVTVCAQMVWNQVNAPPFTDLAPGEVAVKAQSGSFLRFHANGQVEVNLPTGDLTATVAQGNLAATVAQGNATVSATEGNATVSAPAGTAELTAKDISLIASQAIIIQAPSIEGSNGSQTLHKFILDTIEAKYNSHTHVDSRGGTTSVPSVLLDATDESSTFQGA